MAITKITRIVFRRYTDNGQRTIYVQWLDERGRCGRTEGADNGNAHMMALVGRGHREGAAFENEIW